MPSWASESKKLYRFTSDPTYLVREMGDDEPL